MGEREALRHRKQYTTFFRHKPPICAPDSVEAALADGVDLVMATGTDYHKIAMRNGECDSRVILDKLTANEVLISVPRKFDGFEGEEDLEELAGILNDEYTAGIIFHEKGKNKNHAFLLKGPVADTLEARLHDINFPHETHIPIFQAIFRSTQLRNYNPNSPPNAHILYKGPNYHTLHRSR